MHRRTKAAMIVLARACSGPLGKRLYFPARYASFTPYRCDFFLCRGADASLRSASALPHPHAGPKCRPLQNPSSKTHRTRLMSESCGCWRCEDRLWWLRPEPKQIYQPWQTLMPHGVTGRQTKCVTKGRIAKRCIHPALPFGCGSLPLSIHNYYTPISLYCK